MSSRQPGDQGQHSIGHHNLEHWIRQAGRLPELADDHRPRVIEAAAESRVQMGRQRCYRLALLFVSMWLVLSSAARIADEPVRPVASRELSTIFEMRSMQFGRKPVSAGG